MHFRVHPDWSGRISNRILSPAAQGQRRVGGIHCVEQASFAASATLRRNSLIQRSGQIHARVFRRLIRRHLARLID
jgi:hypothetical protein